MVQYTAMAFHGSQIRGVKLPPRGLICEFQFQIAIGNITAEKAQMKTQVDTQRDH